MSWGNEWSLDPAGSLVLSWKESWESMIEHTFSQSWLNEFFTCPERARLQRAGEYPLDDSDASAKGTALHTGIQTVLNGWGPYAVAEKAALETFHEIADQPHFRWVKVKTRETACDHIRKSFALWYDQVYPQLGQPLWVEHPFEFVAYQDDERVIKLRGTVDFMDEYPCLYDWKFSANDEKYGAHGWELARWSLQSTVYTWAAVQAGHFESIEDIPFIFVNIGPYSREPQYLETTRNLENFGFLQQQLIHIAELIEADVPRWPLSDQHALCSPKWCLMWDKCKGKFLVS